jgi:hypothetical protein
MMAVAGMPGEGHKALEPPSVPGIIRSYGGNPESASEINGGESKVDIGGRFLEQTAKGI